MKECELVSRAPHIGARWSASRKRRAGFSHIPGRLTVTALMLLGSLAISPAFAAECKFIGGPQYGGTEPTLAVDANCADPDYNEKTLVIDSTQQQVLKLPDGSTIPYTEVKGHFPATKTKATLPPGITESPTVASHSVVWRFPDKAHWQHRFFQQTYPLPMEFLNTVDSRFAFTHGGYTVGITPGNPNVGYRVSAAAAKLAKAYASKLYGYKGRIYGYMYGQSGGSVQAIGAAEGTSGVWDGIIPVVIATDGLNVHSFLWDGLYAMAIPQAKRDAITAASIPGSGKDMYAGLTNEEHAVLDEYLQAGFARKALEQSGMFKMAMVMAGTGTISSLDPTYEDDFWSKPGYEGTNPPSYLTAAKVDGFATITEVKRDAKNVPTAITFDPSTVPALGSIGDAGLAFYVYAADGVTRIANGDARAINGTLQGNTLTLTGTNDPVLLAALVDGAKIRINNRFILAACFYPRHTIMNNGNPAYDQYRNADGTPKYVQRPNKLLYAPNVRASGGITQTGKLKVKTMVLEDLADPLSYPYVASFYAGEVQKALGAKKAAQMFRVYYNDNSSHGAMGIIPGKLGIGLVGIAGILDQALLDLAAWVEHGKTPLPSTRYKVDAMTQVIVPEKASQRFGLQPVVHLSANGGMHADVGINQPVNLTGEIEMPPRAGKILQYDWYVGTGDSYEPATKLAQPKAAVEVSRTVTFDKPGDYTVTLRTFAQRDGVGDTDSTTLLQNLARVGVSVH
jgi:hypothetical protein